jgi:methylmalonyl-CoA mutase cobalamin-binding subunit
MSKHPSSPPLETAFSTVHSARAPMALRRPRRSLVVFAGGVTASDRPARALERSLLELGVETHYVGRETNAGRIAALVSERRADSVELCLASGAKGVELLRGVLTELIAIGRRDVSIVVHRAKEG